MFVDSFGVTGKTIWLHELSSRARLTFLCCEKVSQKQTGLSIDRFSHLSSEANQERLGDLHAHAAKGGPKRVRRSIEIK